MDGQLISAPKISVEPGVEKVVEHPSDIRDKVKLKISAKDENGKIGLKFNIDYSVDGNARHIEPTLTALPGLESTYKLGRDKAGREILLKVVAVRL